VGILWEHEAGAKTADVCHKHGISGATFYKWKAKHGGLDVSDAKRLMSLEDENAKLKKLLADAMLDNAMLKDVAAKMVTPAAGREAVAQLRVAYEVSEWRACSVRLSTAHILLKRESIVMNHKKLRSTARNGCRCAGVVAASVCSVHGRRWRYRNAPISAGALSDAFADGRRFRSWRSSMASPGNA
jgi:putative transposase